MPNEVVQSPASDSKPEVNNMTAEGFAALRLSQREQRAKAAVEAPKAETKPEATPAEEVEAKPTEEAEAPETPDKEGAKEEQKPKPESKDVLSKSVEELTDEEIQELAQKGKSGLLKRIAELTAKRKLAEEKVAQMEAALKNAQPASLKEEIKDNPYSKIEKVEELQAKYSEVGEVIEWTESVLDKAEHAAGDEIVAEVDGKQLTKSQVEKLRRSAARAKDKFIPAQLKEIQAKQAREQAKAQYREQARKELDWMNGEDNDTRKQFEALLNSPVLEKVRKAVPEAEVDLEYVLAHAANSIWGRKQIALVEKPAAPKLNPPSSPSISAGASERRESESSKAAKDAQKRFESNGSVSDFVALRTAQLSKRKSIK